MSFTTSESSNSSQGEKIQAVSQKSKEKDLEAAYLQKRAKYCEQASEVGTNTLVALDAQGEKLDRISKGMDEIAANMSEAEESMRAMERSRNECKLYCGYRKEPGQDAPKYRVLFGNAN